jgi:hypothetical protein
LRERQAEKQAERQTVKAEMNKPSSTTKTLGAASVVAPELAPIAKLSGMADKYNLAKKASAKTKAARQSLVQKYGIKAIFKPQYWILLVSGVTLKHPFVVFIVSIIAAVLLLNYTFGAVTIVYEMYFLKCCVTFVPNIALGVANAIWFALHGIFYFFLVGVLDIINGIFGWFLGPLYGAINVIGEFLKSVNIVKDYQDMKMTGVGNNFAIEIQPTMVFAYWEPDAITVKYDASNHIDTMATFWGMWGFHWVKPGVPMYSNGRTYFVSENGAVLYTPNLNNDSIADGIITSVPKSATNTILYTADAADMIKRWGDMLTYTQPTNPPPGINYTQQPSNPLINIIPDALFGLLKGIWDWTIGPTWNLLNTNIYP